MGTILVVDDEPDIRQMFSILLKSQGYEVLTAANGQEALDHVEHVLPELILMDLNMPVLNGWETASKLKADTRFCDIPIVAVTAHSLDRELERAYHAGVSEVITKPVDMGNLLRIVRHCLPVAV